LVVFVVSVRYIGQRPVIISLSYDVVHLSEVLIAFESYGPVKMDKEARDGLEGEPRTLMPRRALRQEHRVMANEKVVNVLMAWSCTNTVLVADRQSGTSRTLCFNYRSRNSQGYGFRATLIEIFLKSSFSRRRVCI
jgi:hypothetical protein